MTINTLRIMAGIERRLNTYENKILTTGGFDDLVDASVRYRERMLKWISDEIEKTTAGGVQ